MVLRVLSARSYRFDGLFQDSKQRIKDKPDFSF